MNVRQVLSSERTQKIAPFSVSRYLVGKSPGINPDIHDTAFSVYYIIISGTVKVNASAGPSQRFGGEHNVLIPFPDAEPQFLQYFSSIQLIPRRILNIILFPFFHINLQGFLSFENGSPVCRSVFSMVPVHPPVPAYRHIRLPGKRRTEHSLVHIRINPVIAVHKSDKAPFCDIHPDIPGVPGSAVFFMNHNKPVILSGQPVADLPAPVRGTVVHKNNLQITVGLVQNGFNAAFQIRRNIISRHDDRNQLRLPFERNMGGLVVWYLFHTCFSSVKRINSINISTCQICCRHTPRSTKSVHIRPTASAFNNPCFFIIPGSRRPSAHSRSPGSFSHLWSGIANPVLGRSTSSRGTYLYKISRNIFLLTSPCFL